MPDATTENNDQEKKIAQLIGILKTGERYQLNTQEKDLIHRFLIPIDNPPFHWYCRRAHALRKEVASYAQVWLVSGDQNAEAIVQWKEQQAQVLSTCVDCVIAMEDILLESQFTWVIYGPF